MANFSGICKWVLQIEDSTLSGRVVNLMDGQGLTRYGIGQHSHPHIRPDFYTCSPTEALMTAYSVYKAEYWNRFSGDQLVDDGVASCLLNFSINDGELREVKMLQECLGVREDGIMGMDTLSATNAFNPRILANALRAAQADFYRTVVLNQPTDARFLTGWLRRAGLVYPSLI